MYKTARHSWVAKTCMAASVAHAGALRMLLRSIGRPGHAVKASRCRTFPRHDGMPYSTGSRFHLQLTPGDPFSAGVLLLR
jgi:hypothetical protein